MATATGKRRSELTAMNAQKRSEPTRASTGACYHATRLASTARGSLVSGAADGRTRVRGGEGREPSAPRLPIRTLLTEAGRIRRILYAVEAGRAVAVARRELGRATVRVAPADGAGRLSAHVVRIGARAAADAARIDPAAARTAGGAEEAHVGRVRAGTRAGGADRRATRNRSRRRSRGRAGRGRAGRGEGTLHRRRAQHERLEVKALPDAGHPARAELVGHQLGDRRAGRTGYPVADPVPGVRAGHGLRGDRGRRV